jgi:pimeloyl-ACP methyl ester carboxylesterase
MVANEQDLPPFDRACPHIAYRYMAADAEAFIRALGFKTVDLLGFSIGPT